CAGACGAGAAGGARASTKSKLASAASCSNAGAWPKSCAGADSFGARSVSSTSLFGVSAVSSSVTAPAPEPDGGNALSNSSCAGGCDSANPWAENSSVSVEADATCGEPAGEANGSTSSAAPESTDGALGAEANAGAPGSGTTERPAGCDGARGAGCPGAGVPVPGNGTFCVTALRSPAFGRCTVNGVLHLGHLIERPAGGTRPSSNSYAAGQLGH